MRHHRIGRDRLAETKAAIGRESQPGQRIQGLPPDRVPSLSRSVVLLKPLPYPACQGHPQQEQRHGRGRKERGGYRQHARSRRPTLLFVGGARHKERDRHHQGNGQGMINGVVHNHQQAVDRPDEAGPEIAAHLMIEISFNQASNVPTPSEKLRGPETGVPEVIPRTTMFQ